MTAAVGAGAEPARLVASYVIDAPTGFSPAAQDLPVQLAGLPRREVDSIDSLRHPLNRPVWYLLRWELPAGASADDLWFRTSHLHQRRTDAYLLAGDRVLRTASMGYGSVERGHNWSLEGLDLALPLAGLPGAGFEVLLRVEASAPPIFTPEVVGTRELRDGAVFSWSVCFVYYGGIFFLSLVQVVLLLHFRDRVTRDYVVFAAGMCLGALARYGHFDLVLGPHLGEFRLGDYLLHIRCLNTILGLRALASFFDLAQHMPRLHRVAWAIILVHALVLVASPLAGADLVNLVSAPMRAGALVFAVVVSVVALRRRLIGAPVATLAWTGVIVTDLWLMAMLENVAPRFSGAPLLTIAGILWEMLFNTFALVYRFDRVRDLRQKVELKDAEARSFQRLLRVLCHDVSNPLSAIRFTLDALDPRSPFRAASLDLTVAVQRMRQAESTITGIIENVRAHEVFGLLGGSVPTRPTDVGRCLDDAVDLVSARFFGKSVRVERGYGSLPLWVFAEPTLLTGTVFSNALSNAFKFSPQDGIIRVEARRDGPDWVQVRITDRGAGVAPDILRAFLQSGTIASRPGTGGEAGTGFGLRLMRDYADLMGGEMILRSVSAAEDPLGSGTTVEFRLRAAPAPAVPASPI